jgi:hypothetical protein
MAPLYGARNWSVDASSAPLKTITAELMSFVLAKLLIISATVEVFCPTANTSTWFSIASTATVVFPVWRSPMMSSRWPRPIGIMVSTAVSRLRRALPDPERRLLTSLPKYPESPYDTSLFPVFRTLHSVHSQSVHGRIPRPEYWPLG